MVACYYYYKAEKGSETKSAYLNMKQKSTNRTTECIGLLHSCYHTVQISPKLREKQCGTQRNNDNVDGDNMTCILVVVVVVMMMINGAHVVFKKSGTICRHWVSMCVKITPLILTSHPLHFQHQ